MYKKGNNRVEYERYIHSPEWREKANQRLEQDHHTCCVCGREATEVHHLTYDNFRNEKPDDLVSLCHQCHAKAEEFYDPTVFPLAMNEMQPEGNNFMAAMRVDARNMAPIVFDYLKSVRGSDFEALMSLRQPDDPEGKNYWGTLKKAVSALCRKRYSKSCDADRMTIILPVVANHVVVICLAEIEHCVRNMTQASLHEIVMRKHEECGTWKATAEALGVSIATIQRLKKDEGISAGPYLQEEVSYFCGLDAVAGISPLEGFECLTDEDYKFWNAVAKHVADEYSKDASEGEHKEGDAVNA